MNFAPELRKRMANTRVVLRVGLTVIVEIAWLPMHEQWKKNQDTTTFGYTDATKRG